MKQLNGLEGYSTGLIGVFSYVISNNVDFPQKSKSRFGAQTSERISGVEPLLLQKEPVEVVKSSFCKAGPTGKRTQSSARNCFLFYVKKVA